MRRFLFLFFLLFLLCTQGIQAQRDSSRNEFINAESWFSFEEYGEAEFIYQKLLKQYPGNDNLKYRIGICLLNDPYRKEEAIHYLLEASRNINPMYKEGSFKETAAAPDVLYYLGSAYLVNEKLDEAIHSFREFRKIMDTRMYDEELVQAQINACNNARRLMAQPVDIDLKPVSQEVNTRYPETHPVISGNGQRMAFVTEQPFFDEALFIEKTGDNWTLPMSLTSMLGFDEDIYPLAMNYEGTEMLLYYDDEHIGNLYTSRYEDGFWLPAIKLGPNISTKYWESHACFSKDGNSLYFTSNRKGGNGGLDIYLSLKQPDGSWGTPENLGAPVNTRYNEETPFITEDGQTLYFSSYGHYNMGGYDVFYSKRREDGSWSKPVNMGYPINTTGDDLHFLPVMNGFAAYMSRIEEESAGKRDLYYMDIYSANNPRIYLITGVVRTEDEGSDLTNLEMYVIDPESGDTLFYEIPIAEDGSFSLDLVQGEYMLHFLGDGYDPIIRPLSITPESNKEGIFLGEMAALERTYREPQIFTGVDSQIEVKDSVYEAEADKALHIPVKAEKGSTIIVLHSADSILISQDTLVLDRKNAELVITPQMGENRIELEMIDDEGNIHRRTLTVTGKEPLPTRRELRRQERELRKAGIPPALAGTPVAALLLELRSEAEGEKMQDYLDAMDLEEEGIESPEELFSHLYDQAGEGKLDIHEVDRLLANKISGGDPEGLKQVLLLNADDPLKSYLENLDLEAEGIFTTEDLLRHLDQAGAANGFSMEDVRKAMQKAIAPSPAESYLLELQKDADGALKDYLNHLDPTAEGMRSTADLFTHLYEVADEKGFDKEKVDRLLADELSGGDAQILYQMLLENSDGALREYLEGLDLGKEGIRTVEDLLEHLEKAGAANGFSMDDVRRAMIAALDHPLEIHIIYDELLASADPENRSILESIDLEKEGISSVEELIDALYWALQKEGYSDKEIRKVLNELFPEYEAFIDDLLKGETSNGIALALTLGLSGCIFFLVFFRRKRKKKEEQA